MRKKRINILTFYGLLALLLVKAESVLAQYGGARAGADIYRVGQQRGWTFWNYVFFIIGLGICVTIASAYLGPQQGFVGGLVLFFIVWFVLEFIWRLFGGGN